MDEEKGQWRQDVQSCNTPHRNHRTAPQKQHFQQQPHSNTTHTQPSNESNAVILHRAQFNRRGESAKGEEVATQGRVGHGRTGGREEEGRGEREEEEERKR